MLNTLHKEEINLFKCFKYCSAENINATSHLWHEILEDLYEFMQHGYEYPVAAFVTFLKQNWTSWNQTNYVQYICIISMQWWNSDTTSTTETKTCPLHERRMVIVKAVNVEVNITCDCFYYSHSFIKNALWKKFKQYNF